MIQPKISDDLKEAWDAAVTVEHDPLEEVALGLRRHFRIHVGHLLSAMWKTALAAGHAHDLSTGNPLALMKAGAEGFGVLVATLKAIQEPLNEVEFLACTVLSDHHDGLTPNDLETEIRFRCTEVPPELFPWYLGLDGPYLKRALGRLQPPNTIEDIVAAMRKRDLLKDGALGRVVFIDREVVWRLQ